MGDAGTSVSSPTDGDEDASLSEMEPELRNSGNSSCAWHTTPAAQQVLGWEAEWLWCPTEDG